jgi:Kef-type K+ transport system membrane component KefB
MRAPQPQPARRAPAPGRVRVPGPIAATGIATLALLLATPAHAATGSDGGHLLSVLEALVLIIVFGKLGGALFARFRQATVLGELLAGVLLGNLGLMGFHALDGLKGLPGLDLLAQIGVLFLLFTVGLQSDLGKMIAVGRSSFAVAALGVVAPGLLGWITARTFLPGHDELVYWFVGATLSATSVGITARVLGDLKRTTGGEGRIILGAAVIDDVLGLIVLAVVSGIIRAADAGEAFRWSSLVRIVAQSIGFLALALVLGRWLSRRAFALAARLPGESMLLPLALAFCFGLAALAGRAGLAPIVGAFAAGLVLDEVHFGTLRERDHRRRGLEELLEPISSFLVPVFFVLMGMRVDLAVFARTDVLGFSVALTLAAVVGKQLCALGVFERGVDRIAVGLGMIPRGEVGLIFAGIGATLLIRGERVVDDAVYSAVVVMVVLTTLMTPPLLTWKLGHPRGAPANLPETPR